MKINKKDAIYIQNIDLIYLSEGYVPIPPSIYKKINLKKNYINDKTKYKFIKFTLPEEITFLNSIPWIVDYNEVKDTSPEEIGKMINNLRNKKELLKQAKNISSEETINNLVEEQNIELKIHSLREILWHKTGDTKMSIPKDKSPKRIRKK